MLTIASTLKRQVKQLNCFSGDITYCAHVFLNVLSSLLVLVILGIGGICAYIAYKGVLKIFGYCLVAVRWNYRVLDG